MLRKRKDDIYNSAKWDLITKILVALLAAFLIVYCLIQFIGIPFVAAIVCLIAILAALLITLGYAIYLAISELKRGGLQYQKLFINIGVIAALIIVIIMNFAYLADQDQYARNVTWSTIVLSFVTIFQVVYAVIEDSRAINKGVKENNINVTEMISKKAVKGNIDNLVDATIYNRNVEIAKRMLDDNVLALSKISEYTSLPIETIRSLQWQQSDKSNTEQKG